MFTYLSEQVREVISRVDFTDPFSSTTFGGLHHYRVANFLCSLVIERDVRKSACNTHFPLYTIRWIAYFHAMLYILDAAELIQVVRNVDDLLLLVILWPVHCQTWKRRSQNVLSIETCQCPCALLIFYFIWNVRNVDQLQYSDTRIYDLPVPLQGSVGIPAVWATMEEAILSPSAHIAWLGGPKKRENNFNTLLLRYSGKWRTGDGQQNDPHSSPMKAMPCFWRSSGSLGFSEACPHPAHTAYNT